MNKIVNPQKYKKRIIDDVIESYLTIAGALCIEGPKWCGKTWTSSIHSNSEFLVGDPKNNFSNRQLAELDPQMILQGPAPRLIDEWQEVPAIWDATRAEVDRRQDKGQIILTGSSTPKKKGILHSGTGRIVKLRMNTMSLYESNDSTGDISLKDLCYGKIENKITGEVELEKLAYLIVRGGWPANLNIDPSKVNLIPKAYMEGVIEEDLGKLDDDFVYNKHKVKLLLKSIARNESTTVSNLSLLNDISDNDDENISRNTVDKYLEALNRLFIFNNQIV